MSLPALLVSLALANAAPPPELRVAIGDLDFARIEDRATFRARLGDATRAFCGQHRALITPTHVRARGWCERALGAEAVSRLPGEARRELRRDRPSARPQRPA